MRLKSLALLSAAVLLTSKAQGGRSPAGQQASISLGGRYLAARVAEQDHDYENGAIQLDLALAQTPNDPELIDEMAGARAAAEPKYRRAATLDPSALRIVVSVAEGLRRLGKGPDAQA